MARVVGVEPTTYGLTATIPLTKKSAVIRRKQGFLVVCNRLVRELGLSVQLKHEYETEINSAGDYQSRLTVTQKWFGIVFVER